MKKKSISLLMSAMITLSPATGSITGLSPIIVQAASLTSYPMDSNTSAGISASSDGNAVSISIQPSGLYRLTPNNGNFTDSIEHPYQWGFWQGLWVEAPLAGANVDTATVDSTFVGPLMNGNMHGISGVFNLLNLPQSFNVTWGDAPYSYTVNSVAGSGYEINVADVTSNGGKVTSTTSYTGTNSYRQTSSLQGIVGGDNSLTFTIPLPDAGNHPVLSGNPVLTAAQGITMSQTEAEITVTIPQAQAASGSATVSAVYQESVPFDGMDNIPNLNVEYVLNWNTTTDNTSYTIAINNIDGAPATSDLSQAAAGTLVTVSLQMNNPDGLFPAGIRVVTDKNEDVFTNDGEWNSLYRSFTFVMPASNVTVTPLYSMDDDMGNFVIRAASTTGGSFTYTPSIVAPESGEKVTVSTKPDAGYQTGTVTFTGGKYYGYQTSTIQAREVAQNTYEFTPEWSGTITVTFVKAGQPTPNLPSVPAPRPVNPGDSVTESETTLETDGNYITNTISQSGITSTIEQTANGLVTQASVTVPAASIQNGNVLVSLGTNTQTGIPILVPGNASGSQAARITVTLPSSTGPTDVVLPLEKGTATLGTVAMMVNSNGSLTPIIASVIDSEGNLIIPMAGTQTIAIVNNSKSFPDLSGNEWYVTEGAVSFVSARQIINGDANGYFDANGTVDRGMFSRMLWNLAGNPETVSAVPSDVDPDSYFAKSAAWAKANGLMGVGSAFNPFEEISREQLATIFYRFYGSPTVDTSVLDGYSDRNSVSDYAVPAVAWMVSNGIMGQGSNLDPFADATRAQMAAIIERTLLSQWQ